MRFTSRSVALLALASLVSFISTTGMLIVMAIVVAASIVDALAVRSKPVITRNVGAFARGVPTKLTINASVPHASKLEIRQPLPPDMGSPQAIVQGSEMQTTLLPKRRGRYLLPQVAVCSNGPLGLGRWFHEAGEPTPIKVYPDLPAAERLAEAVRQRSIRAVGSRRRGPLGLGTEFESVREYRTDDDVRQINWRATSRLGRAMSNNLRVEQDTDLWIVIDAGRLSSASMRTNNALVTRLDVALDAAAALALVADDLSDRVGFIAYAADVLTALPPRRRGGATSIEAAFGLESTFDESDHAAAFAAANANRRGLVFVFTDLIDPAAGQSLLAALPGLARRHSVIVVAADDPAFVSFRTSGTPGQKAVMSDVDASITETIHLIRGTGAHVLVAPADRFAEAAVRSYVHVRSAGVSRAGLAQVQSQLPKPASPPSSTADVA